MIILYILSRKGILSKLNLANEINVNRHGVESEFKCIETVFHPSRHVTPTNPNGYIHMSPIEAKTFCACQPMQNI